ncbi:MAG: ferrous iron transport protein B [Clostridia bacterium]|nr:ferrous iron transport protein B [Clostridia bacterium]
MTLKDIRTGNSAVITKVGGSGSLRQHFLDMGIIPGETVTVEKYAPMGDPMQIKVHGYELTLRLDDAKNIEVSPCKKSDDKPAEKKASVKKKHSKNREIAHPGLGEEGKYHEKANEEPLPDDTILTYALVGNQNSGKTTLFNRLTGSRQHVGNFPGVTVDRKDGAIRGYPKTLVTDLPGIYSMSPYTSEEIVSRNFVLNEKPKAIINIVDATNIERNLYLTMQLLEMDVPMVIALNIMDEVTGNGGSIDINALEALLGVPVVPISAAKNEGVDELVKHALHIAHYGEKPKRQDFCSVSDHNGAVHKCLHAVIHLIEDKAKKADMPVRFAASKLVEGDSLIPEKLGLDDSEKEILEHIIKQMEKERGLDRNAAIADMRFSFIERVCSQTVVKPGESKEHIRSRKIDRVLTGKFTAIPCFILIMLTVFWLTFDVVGAFLQNLLEDGMTALKGQLQSIFEAYQVNDVLKSLLLDGVFEGISSVLSFLPVIIILFLFLSLLEDSGYLARVAFFMDKLLRKIGLSGRSIVPMLIGFGCTVPAVMSTRTLPSERDRRMTVLLTPFMSCSAKLPIYAFLVNVFFDQYRALVMIGLYVLGILLGIIAALVYKKTLFRGEAVPFVMELPNYRLPGAKNVAHLLWEKSKDFLQRAFTVIFVASIVVWLLQNFDAQFNLTSDPQKSILSVIAGFVAPVFAPAGLGDWRLVTALFTGFMAKESVVSTLDLLFAEGIAAAISPVTALCMLVFCLLYTPCVAAVAAVKRELGGKWALGVVVFQCVTAWAAAAIINLMAVCFHW